MKIFKTKNVILAVVAALVLLSTLPFLQSCSNSDDITNSAASKYDDLKPIAIVNNEIELEQVKSNVRNMIKNMASAKPLLFDSTKNKLQYSYSSNKSTLNNRSLRIKADNPEGNCGNTGGSVNYGSYQINVLMTWDRPMGSISTSSWLTGNTLFFRYEQTKVQCFWSYGNDWCTPTSDVWGVVYFRVIFKGVLETQSDNISLEVTGPVLQK